MPPLILPAMAVAVGILLLVFVWRLAREARRRFEYWKAVLTYWRSKHR